MKSGKPNEKQDGIQILDTPDGIRVFQLLAARAAIKLEKVGMKHSRGSVRKMWAKHYGMSGGANHDQVIARMEQELKSLGWRPKEPS